MVNYSKTIIAPIIGLIVLGMSVLFGIEVDQDLQEQVITYIASGISLVVTLYGIFKNHKKEEKPS